MKKKYCEKNIERIIFEKSFDIIKMIRKKLRSEKRLTKQNRIEKKNYSKFNQIH